MSRRTFFAAGVLVCCAAAVSCNGTSTSTGTATTTATGTTEPNTTESNTTESNTTVAGSTSTSSTGTFSSTANTNHDQQAVSILREVAQFYGKADALAVDFKQSTSVQFQGENNESTVEFGFAAQRPNRLAIRDAKGELADFVSNGDKMYTVVHQMKKYTETDAPESFSALAKDPMTMNMMGMGNMVAIRLLSEDPYAAMMDGVTKAAYVGEESLGATKSHHLKIEQNEFDWEMWVAADGDRQILMLKFDMNKQLAAAGQSDAKMSVTVLFKNWNLNPTLEEEAFAFAPSPGVEKVNSFFEGMQREKPVSSLVGQPGPAITSTMLDGSPFDLQSHQGQNIVMVDFWATWCGPCVKELPILMKVARQYADRGVKLYAVNQGENKATIQSFLDQQKWKLNVVLDERGAAGGAYGVEGIPQLVIIDKAGKVQSVHVGYSPAIEGVLQKELDALLAGQDLAAEAAAKSE